MTCEVTRRGIEISQKRGTMPAEGELEGRTHVSGRVECEVESSVGDLDEVLGDRLSLGKVERVNELGRSELEGNLLLLGVGVDRDDPRRLLDLRSLEESESDATGSEDGDGRVVCRKGKQEESAPAANGPEGGKED